MENKWEKTIVMWFKMIWNVFSFPEENKRFIGNLITKSKKKIISFSSVNFIKRRKRNDEEKWTPPRITVINLWGAVVKYYVEKNMSVCVWSFSSSFPFSMVLALIKGKLTKIISRKIISFLHFWVDTHFSIAYSFYKNKN